MRSMDDQVTRAPAFRGMAETRLWQSALAPGITLLGAALPLAFLTWIEQYLYYLRPRELLPTYATAWLLLAAVALPVTALAALLLGALSYAAAHGPGQHIWARLRRGLELLLDVIATTILLATLAEAAIVWVRTFGVIARAAALPQLTMGLVAAGVLLTVIPRTRSALRSATRFWQVSTLIGLLTLSCLPFCGWGADRQLDLAAQPASVSGARGPGRPNILLVTIDALSAQHMSLYGASRPTTPNLDAFARGATVFDHFYANANFTTPGVSSLLTSTRPWTHRALELPSWPRTLARGESLPALLERAGYRTGYVSTNPQAGAAKNGMGPYFEFAAYDRTHGLPLCADRWSEVLKYDCAAAQLPLFNALSKLYSRIFKTNNDRYDPRLAIQPALAWLAQIANDRPVFLWVHFLPPHSPYAAPAPWLGHFDASQIARRESNSEPAWNYLMRSEPPALQRTLEARYDEAIQYVDHYVGVLLRGALAQLGTNTVVVVTADHGESFHHGYGGHQGPELYEEVVHIPLIVKLPQQRAGSRTEVIAEQVDIAPTLAALAGVPASGSWEGRSLLSAMAVENTSAALDDRPAYTMDFEQNGRLARLSTGSIAVVDGRWKLVHYMGVQRYPLMPSLHDALYDLESDPGELHDRAGARPDQMRRLEALISDELARHGGSLAQ
jgi:arylsulfatase A-like enzyme